MSENLTATNFRVFGKAGPVDPEIKDWLLVNLLYVTERTEASFAITLNVGGQIVSGNTCGGKKYFELFASSLASGFSEPENKGVRDFTSQISQLGGIYNDIPAIENFNPTYIHLSHARLFAPGQKPIPETGDFLWRGRLTSVDGFFLGSLKA